MKHIKLINKSTYNNRFLNASIRFIERYNSKLSIAKLIVYNKPNRGLTEGITYQIDPDGFVFCPHFRPSTIEIAISSRKKYPRKHTYLKTLGPIVFNSKFEELLYVISHESAHLKDIWLNDKVTEKRAELYAQRILRLYRHYNNNKC